MKRILILTLLIITFSNTYAIDGIIIRTIDYSLNEKWNNSLSLPKITTCDTVFTGQNVFITAIAIDYKLNSENKAFVKYSMKITKPDNSIYFSQKDLPLIDEVLPNNKNLQMSDAKLKISFEDKDILGEYIIEITIYDEISNKSITKKASIFHTKIPSIENYKVTNQDDFMKWIGNYYESPKPETALANYIFYTTSKLSEEDDRFYTIFSVFLEIFENNKFLLPQILNSYNKQELKTKLFLIYLMHFSDIGATDFLENLNGSEKEYYVQVKNSKLPELNGEIIDRTQLDMLWATFLASGRYEPILKLIKTLDYAEYLGELEKYKNSQDKTEENRRKAINNSIYTSLVWSIKSNCKQHELVKGYAEWTLQFGDLNKIQKEELTKILQNI